LASEHKETPRKYSNVKDGKANCCSVFVLRILLICKLFLPITVGTCNKAKVGKHRIFPYCESFLYCESCLFVHGKLVSREKCIIVSFYTTAEFLIVESLIANSDCTFLTAQHHIMKSNSNKSLISTSFQYPQSSSHGIQQRIHYFGGGGQGCGAKNWPSPAGGPQT